MSSSMTVTPVTSRPAGLQKPTTSGLQKPITSGQSSLLKQSPQSPQQPKAQRCNPRNTHRNLNLSINMYSMYIPTYIGEACWKKGDIFSQLISNLLKKIFWGQCHYLSFSIHRHCILSHLYTTALLFFPKNLIPWLDSNPGLLVPEADAMSTAPSSQG
jgi:hypothetical protein